MVTSTNLTRWLFVGDSITSLLTGPVGNWPGVPGSFIDQARTQSVSFVPATSRTVIPARLGQTAPGSYTPLTSTGRRQVMSVYGVGGRTIAGLAADLQASIYNWNPDIIGMLIGTNDFGGGTDVSVSGAFQTSYNQVLDGVAANLPGCKVLCMTPSIRAESWTAAGPHLTDGLDTWPGLTRIAECVASHSSFCELVDVLTPAFVLTRAMQPVAGSSVTPKYSTRDSLHPTPFGDQIIAAALMPHVQWS